MADKDAQATMASDEDRTSERVRGEGDEFFDASNVDLENVEEIERSERDEVRYKLEEVGVKWDSKWSTAEARRRLQKRLDAINAESEKTAAGSGPATLTPRTDKGDSSVSTIEMLLATMMQQQQEDRKVFTAVLESLRAPASTNPNVASSGRGGHQGNNGGGGQRSDAAKLTARPPEMISDGITFKEWKTWVETWDNRPYSVK